MTYSADTGSMFCCGVREIGGFDEGYTTGETPQEFLAAIFKEDRQHVGQYSKDRLYHIWFVKHKKFDGGFSGQHYQYDELRKYVQTLPGVIPLGSHINPNTGNKIDGYFFKEPQE